jgi:peptidoglycan biosynthesis protein MviN/MurJ (putative lipid II flippase)
MVALNVLLNVVFVVGLGLDTAGLTLSTALTAWINLLWHLVGLRTHLALPSAEGGLGTRIGRMTLAALASAGVAWAVHRGVALALGAYEPRRSLAALLAALGAAVVVYALVCHRLGVPELQELLRRLRGRFQPPGTPSSPNP